VPTSEEECHHIDRNLPTHMLVKSNILTMSFFLFELGRSRFSHKKTLNSNLTLNLVKTYANLFSVIGKHLIFSSTVREAFGKMNALSVRGVPCFEALYKKKFTFSHDTQWEFLILKQIAKVFTLGKVHNLKLYPSLSETPVKLF